MTLTEHVKILDNKIKSNKAEYDLDREAAKISALSSKDLEKKHGYKNLKDFSYHVDEVNKADVTEKEDEDETDQELPSWIKVPKSRFNEIKDVISRANES